jgi:Holliday junction resolvase RusA-like endonuclease
MDVDNIAKITLDSITHSGLIRDDSLVHDLHVTKYPTDGPEEMMLSAKEWIL